MSGIERSPDSVGCQRCVDALKATCIRLADEGYTEEEAIGALSIMFAHVAAAMSVRVRGGSPAFLDQIIKITRDHMDDQVAVILRERTEEARVRS